VNLLVAGQFAVALDCLAARTGESAAEQAGGTVRTPYLIQVIDQSGP
jgi:hypothetical protein